MREKLKNFFRPRCTVRFHMKSGNVIVADRVGVGFEVTTQGNSVTGISKWNQRKPKHNLMLSALALDQIEAITYNL